jgi:FhuF 2Fe-2S C-terminal domain
MAGSGSGGGIEATLNRVAAGSADGLSIRVSLVPAPKHGWIEFDRLLDSDPLKASLFAQVAGVGARPPDHVCAEWMVESFARAITDLAGSCLVAERRLPDLSAENLVVATYKGMVAATGVRTTAMTALEDDGEAVAAGARAVPDWPGLAERMADGLASLLGPIIGWTDGNGLRPAKTLWQAAGDVSAQSLVWSGKAFDGRGFALELTRRLMAPDPPFAVPVRRGVDPAGEQFHLRTTCCLAYRTPEGGICRSCPIGHGKTGVGG